MTTIEAYCNNSPNDKNRYFGIVVPGQWLYLPPNEGDILGRLYPIKISDHSLPDKNRFL